MINKIINEGIIMLKFIVFGVISATLIGHMEIELLQLVSNLNYLVKSIIFLVLNSIVLIVHAVADMQAMLKRFEVTQKSYKLNYNILQELVIIIEYSLKNYDYDISRPIHGGPEQDYMVPLKRYTNAFYIDYRKNGENEKMINMKMSNAHSESFIMKNNLPKKITQEEICQRWKEPGTDIAFYGFLIVVNIILALF